MKESRLLEMERNINTLGGVAKELTLRLEQLKMVVMGDHEVLKRMNEFNDIINQLQKEHEDGKENTSGIVTGTDRSNDSGLELS